MGLSCLGATYNDCCGDGLVCFQEFNTQDNPFVQGNVLYIDLALYDLSVLFSCIKQQV